MATRKPSKKQIVNAAVSLAKHTNWQSVQMHQIAQVLHIELASLEQVMPDKEAIVHEWFAMANAQMLKLTDDDAFKKAHSSEKLQRLMIGWLDAMGEHRVLTQQMVASLLNPLHPLVCIENLAHFERTVHWLLDASERDPGMLMRTTEETAFAGVLLLALRFWFEDKSPKHYRTNAYVKKRLQQTETFLKWVPFLPAGQARRARDAH